MNNLADSSPSERDEAYSSAASCQTSTTAWRAVVTDALPLLLKSVAIAVVVATAGAIEWSEARAYMCALFVA